MLTSHNSAVRVGAKRWLLLIAACLTLGLVLQPTNHEIAGAAISSSNCFSHGYDCATGGYVGHDSWGYDKSSSTTYGLHNCTSYAAFKLNANGVRNPGNLGDASNWASNARAKGIHIDPNPAVGAIAQWNRGHVAYVEEVGNGYIITTDDNYYFPQYDKYTGGTSRQYLTRKQGWPDNFIYFQSATPVPAPVSSPYLGHIVKWAGEKPTPVTAWYVTADGRRLWIKDGGVYNCLKSSGAAGPDLLSPAQLNQLPDQTNNWATCGPSMIPNQVLRRNMHMTSPDGRYQFWLQGDGNIVLYGPSGRAIWATNRFNADVLIFQGDGNLVAYTNGGGVVWSSGSYGRGGQSLWLQPDGNLVIYSSNGRALWSTGTAGRT